MTYVIAGPCLGVKDKACAGDCPAGCICEGERMLCIHPGECAGSGACEPVCPAGAVVCEDDVPGQWAEFTAKNAQFSGQPSARGGAAFAASWQDRYLAGGQDSSGCTMSLCEALKTSPGHAGATDSGWSSMCSSHTGIGGAKTGRVPSAAQDGENR
jgi:Fe-S-cluster-containing hydrogenase component 2